MSACAKSGDTDERLREERETPMSVLAGGVFAADTDDDLGDLRSLVDDIGSRAAEARIGQRRLPEVFDETAWRNLEETGLSRLTSTPDLGAGPAEAAIVLRGTGPPRGRGPGCRNRSAGRVAGR